MFEVDNNCLYFKYGNMENYIQAAELSFFVKKSNCAKNQYHWTNIFRKDLIKAGYGNDL